MRPALTLLALFMAVDASVLVLHVVNELAGFNAVLFNLDEEQNLPTWLSSLQFAAVTAAAALAGTASAGRERLAWWTLAAVFLFLSADETALVHEKLAAHAEPVLGGIPKLPVLYSPIALACTASALVIAGQVARAVGSSRLLAGGFAFLAASVVLDAADVQALDVSRLRPLIVVEEAAELAGTALLAAVAVATFLVRSCARGDDDFA